MKALTISQPHASLIASGEKFVENRYWPTTYRGPLAIHAGKGGQYLTSQELGRYPTGCVIAVARLARCIQLSVIQDHQRSPEQRSQQVPNTSRTWQDIANHKYAEGPWCWILEDIVALPEPIPARGAQKLWDFHGLEVPQ